MDRIIYEEFKGTGNMELHLSRKIAENASSRLSTTTVPVPMKELHPTHSGRAAENVDPAQIIHPMGEIDAMEFLINKLAMTKTNDDFFDMMKRS